MRPALPEQFLENMKALLGDSFDEYLNSYDEKPLFGLRINENRISKDAFLALAEKAGWELKPVPWIDNGFYYEEELKPAKHPWYYAGLYYLQEPSAMTPANLLPVEAGDKVADLCAAPGGKSTELSSKLIRASEAENCCGMLLSNDISNSRAKALLKNLEITGARMSMVSSEAPEKLAVKYKEYFNKILVDAPCSGEGMFRRDSDMLKSYAEKGPEFYAPIQAEILEQAYQMLAPGGMLLYSTCTFDKTEDEGNVTRLLENHPDMKLVMLPQKDGFSRGFGYEECVRLFPHKISGEGHFIALFRKSEENYESAPLTRSSSHGSSGIKASKVKLPDEAGKFLEAVIDGFDISRVYAAGENLYYLPEVSDISSKLNGIRYLRTGIHLGSLKKERFEPAQALAMTLKMDETPSAISFASDDIRCVKYLKGETVSLEAEELDSFDKKALKKMNNYVLVGVDGYSLGWAKLAGASLKNKYYPGWRWQ